MKDSSIKITRERDCVVAYVDDEFYCSGDTYQEVIHELEKEGLA